MPEPKELVDARRALAAAEGDLRSADGLAELQKGLALLRDVIDEGPAVAAKTGENLAASYAKRVYERVGALIAADPQLPEPELEHYFKVVLAFDDVGSALPASAARLKIGVVRALIERYYEGHPAEKKRQALEQLSRLGGSE